MGVDAGSGSGSEVAVGVGSGSGSGVVVEIGDTSGVITVSGSSGSISSGSSVDTSEGAEAETAGCSSSNVPVSSVGASHMEKRNNTTKAIVFAIFGNPCLSSHFFNGPTGKHMIANSSMNILAAEGKKTIALMAVNAVNNHDIHFANFETIVIPRFWNNEGGRLCQTK